MNIIKCFICEKQLDIEKGEVHLTNRKHHVCDQCSWFWPTDIIHNVKMEPDTFPLTEDMWREIGRKNCFIMS